MTTMITVRGKFLVQQNIFPLVTGFGISSHEISFSPSAMTIQYTTKGIPGKKGWHEMGSLFDFVPPVRIWRKGENRKNLVQKKKRNRWQTTQRKVIWKFLNITPLHWNCKINGKLHTHAYRFSSNRLPWIFNLLNVWIEISFTSVGSAKEIASERNLYAYFSRDGVDKIKQIVLQFVENMFVINLWAPITTTDIAI